MDCRYNGNEWHSSNEAANKSNFNRGKRFSERNRRSRFEANAYRDFRFTCPQQNHVRPMFFWDNNAANIWNNIPIFESGNIPGNNCGPSSVNNFRPQVWDNNIINAFEPSGQINLQPETASQVNKFILNVPPPLIPGHLLVSNTVQHPPGCEPTQILPEHGSEQTNDIENKSEHVHADSLQKPESKQEHVQEKDVNLQKITENCPPRQIPKLLPKTININNRKKRQRFHRRVCHSRINVTKNSVESSKVPTKIIQRTEIRPSESLLGHTNVQVIPQSESEKIIQNVAKNIGINLNRTHEINQDSENVRSPSLKNIPNSKMGVKKKLLAEFLNMSVSQKKEILMNPHRSKKYKVVLDILNREKRLSTYNELQLKYPRTAPPAGNTSLINPEESVNMEQLPSHLIKGIEDFLSFNEREDIDNEQVTSSEVPDWSAMSLKMEIISPEKKFCATMETDSLENADELNGMHEQIDSETLNLFDASLLSNIKLESIFEERPNCEAFESASQENIENISHEVTPPRINEELLLNEEHNNIEKNNVYNPKDLNNEEDQNELNKSENSTTKSASVENPVKLAADFGDVMQKLLLSSSHSRQMNTQESTIIGNSNDVSVSMPSNDFESRQDVVKSMVLEDVVKIMPKKILQSEEYSSSSSNKTIETNRMSHEERRETVGSPPSVSSKSSHNDDSNSTEEECYSPGPKCKKRKIDVPDKGPKKSTSSPFCALCKQYLITKNDVQIIMDMYEMEKQSYEICKKKMQNYDKFLMAMMKLTSMVSDRDLVEDNSRTKDGNIAREINEKTKSGDEEDDGNQLLTRITDIVPDLCSVSEDNGQIQKKNNEQETDMDKKSKDIESDSENNPITDRSLEQQNIVENVKPESTNSRIQGIKDCSVVLKRFEETSQNCENTGITDRVGTSVEKIQDNDVMYVEALPESAIEVSDEEDQNSHVISFTGHKDPITALCAQRVTIFAACDDGRIYCYNKNSGLLERVLFQHFEPITHVDIYKKILYSISLDSKLQSFGIMPRSRGRGQLQKLNMLAELSGPAQTFDTSWDRIYIGTRTGHVDIYDISKKELLDPLKICDTHILSLVCGREGPRNILLIAVKNGALSVRDAQTGLWLRTMETPGTSTSNSPVPDIYSLLLRNSNVYCGTSGSCILVYNFTSAEHKNYWPGGRGAVCLKSSNGFLFSGCYDGNIYVHRMKTGEMITKLKAPGKMLLTMCIIGDEIIASTKDKALVLSKLPKKLSNVITNF